MEQTTATAPASRGFTLIELMIVVAIIAILAAISLPAFITYRQKSVVAAGFASAHTIRTALINLASSNNPGCFPAAGDMTNWSQLAAICNQHGAQLFETAERSGFQDWLQYLPHDLEGDGKNDEFYLVLRVGGGVPQTLTGAQIEISPSGITRQTY
jgi:prepilin-type N-terminal cleavage/methylation domain-containing protein